MNEEYTLNLLIMMHGILTKDTAAAEAAAEVIGGMQLGEDEILSLREMIFNNLDYDLTRSEMLLILNALGLTKTDYILDLLEFNQQNADGMSTEEFKKTAAYQYMTAPAEQNFYSDTEKRMFFNTLAVAAIGLRDPQLIQQVIDQMQTAA